MYPKHDIKCLMPYCIWSSLSKRWKGINVSGLHNETVLEMIHMGLLTKDELIIRLTDKIIFKWSETFKTDLIKNNRKYMKSKCVKEWLGVMDKYY